MTYAVKHKTGKIDSDNKILSKDLKDIADKKNIVKGNGIIKVLPKQYEFINSKKPEVLMSGGVGCGKSLSLCLALVQRAMIPGNVCLLVRKNLTDLKASTLRMLLEPEGSRKPILPLGSYTWNKSDKIIELRGGGHIFYTGCDDPLKIRSINAGDIFIDEASQLDLEEYNELKMRLRVDTGRLQIMSVTNPSNKSHWLYKMFVLENEPFREIIYGNALHNIYLPKRTLDHYSTFKGTTYERMVEGKWIALDKMVYKMFNPSLHVKDINIDSLKDKIKDWFIPIDIGWVHPSAMLLIGYGKDNKVYVFDEFCKSEQLIHKLGFHLSVWCKEINNPTILADPSAAQVRNELISKGYSVDKAPNEVESGIGLVQSLLDEGNLVINKKCTRLIAELEGYSRDDNGKIIKEFDDTADCLRYGTSAISLMKAKAMSQFAEFYVPSINSSKVQNSEDEGYEYV